MAQSDNSTSLLADPRKRPADRLTLLHLRRPVSRQVTYTTRRHADALSYLIYGASPNTTSWPTWRLATQAHARTGNLAITSKRDNTFSHCASPILRFNCQLRPASPRVPCFGDSPTTFTTQSLPRPFADCCARNHGVSSPRIPAPRRRLKNLDTPLSSYLHCIIFGSRFMRLSTGVRAHGTPIFALNDAQTLCLMAMVRRNLSHVRCLCAFTPASSQSPTFRISIVFVTPLNCTVAKVPFLLKSHKLR